MRFAAMQRANFPTRGKRNGVRIWAFTSTGVSASFYWAYAKIGERFKNVGSSASK